MPFTFVFGPSGSGKSHYLYRKTIHESLEHPEENYMVIVPEQFTMQTQKDLVLSHPRKGIMNIDVLSFARLAYRVFEETGEKNLPVLDDEGKNLVLKKIASDYEGRLKVLRGNIQKPGYISEVKSVISEFTQYDITGEKLEKVIARTGEESGLSYKLRDIRLLYEGFLDYLQEKFITKEELLDVLSAVVGKSGLLKNTTIVLDGFTGFTPVQNRLILELAKTCRQVYLAVTMDEREDPFCQGDPFQLFRLSKKMVSSLVGLAREAGVEIAEPVCLYRHPVYRFRGNESMAFLERNLFRHGKQQYQKKVGNIRLHVAKNPREEALSAAERIRFLVREKGFRYREIGVIASSMDIYGGYLEEAFLQYDIPAFMDRKRSILFNPFVEYVRSVLAVAEQDFSYESVFRFLRTGLSGFTYDEVDRLDNYCIGLGIKGAKKWRELWVRRLGGMTEEDLEEMNRLRIRFLLCVEELFTVLKKRRKTVAEVTRAMYGFMVKERLQIRIKEQEEQFQKKGELALAKEYAQVYRILIELFDKFVELLGEETVSLKEYRELLDAGLEEAKVGVIPPSTDQVVVGDVERTRLKDIKALIFVGAVDTCLPGSLAKNGLLSERDRAVFDGENLPLSPGGKERAYDQKFYLYLNLTKPSEYLDIYYCKVSGEGKALRPSYLIQEIRKLYPSLPVEEEEKKGIFERELTARTALPIWIGKKRLFPEELDATWCELYTWYRKNPRWKGKIRALLEAGVYERPKDSFSGQTAKKLYGEGFTDSISRIELFDACAFAHFLTYGLKLREREEYTFEALDLGNLCHRALERFSRKVEKEGLLWTTLTDAQRDAWMEESLEEAIADYGNSILYSTARNEALLARIRKLLKCSIWAMTKQLRAGDFEAKEYEVRFANGKIDRIDTCEDENGVYVKVVDYKTGRKEFDISALYYGLQLQLMVYMDAAVKREQEKHPGKDVIPAGVFYYRISDPLVELPDSSAPEDETERRILKELCPDGLVNLSGNALGHLEHGKSGDSIAVPVKFNKDGSLSKGSKAVAARDFERMLQYALECVQEAHRRIQNGDAKVNPYRMGTGTACDFCGYRHVCGFDTRLPGDTYRELEKLSREAAIAAMEGGAGHGRNVDKGAAERDHAPE